MRVQFDLRPASLLEKERKKSSFNVVRLVAFLLLLFFVLSNGFYIGKMTLELVVLRESVEEKQSEVLNMETQKQGLEGEINRLRAREKVFTDTLRIMQDELPTLEVLWALEDNMPEGMAASRLAFTPPRAANAPATAVLEATSENERQIIDLTTGLSMSGVFSSVVMPTSRLDEKTGRVSFTLNMDLRSMGQIRSAK
ncbi:MAG: hypothetical protein LBQ90_12375 [Synergistaceae bacterium]|jgi:hypothetical protein|nr:hypothetical protein [Synergistaceae bacterium]